MYNDLYATEDSHLTDGNVEDGKERNIRDSIFILGAVINSVTNGAEEPIQVQVVDVENALINCGLKPQLVQCMKLTLKVSS